MDAETLSKLHESLEGKENNTLGIGVGNIYRRIKAMYDGADMTIDSREGEGTTITIKIPYLAGDTNFTEENN